MPSLLIRRVTLSFSALVTAALLLVGGLGAASLSAAQAADSTTVVLNPAAVSAGPGDNLSVTVTVTNPGAQALPAGELVVTAPSAVLSSVSDLDSWFAAEDGETQPGRFLQSADVAEIPAGKTVDVVVELPLSLGRFGGIWGVRGLAVDYLLDGSSAGSARSSFVWTPLAAPEKTAFTGILALVPPPSTSGLLTEEQLSELTGPSGMLTRQLAVAQGRPVAIGLDPRILTSIDVLGDKAPESALTWLSVLKSLPNETFLLAYADADISAQAQAGASSLVFPDTTDVIVPLVQASATATPAPTQAPIPVAEPLFTPTLSNVAWPASNSVVASDLGIFAASGYTSSILSSGNVTGNVMSSGVAGGLPSAVTLNGLSSALENNDLARAASYLAVSSVDETQAGRSLAALPRETFSITGLTKLGLTLDALAAQSWVGAGTLSSALSSAASELQIVDVPESNQRISVVSSLLARNAAIAAFSTIAETPGLITSPASRELAAVLSVGWINNPEWSEAVSESLRESDKVLNSVSIVTSSTINMVGGQANIPISVLNSLLQPVTVKVEADPNNARLIVNGSKEITIQPESQAKAQIPVQAQVSNGSSILTVSMTSIDGVPIGQPVAIPINVRADWETWGLAAVALAFVGLLTAGVIRTIRRRKKNT
jgi:hypothetical protein